MIDDWFKSYLIGRRQYTTVNGYISDVSQTLCGVPQGSVLGPLLYLFLYIYGLSYINLSIRFISTCLPMIVV